MSERASLRTHSYGSGPTRVVAVHGITANGMSMAGLAAALGDLAVTAPDLAGRACSADRDNPEGLRTHAEDVIALLEQARAESGRPAVLLGHSMGAFVCAVAAAQRPDLVAALFLIDGGLAFPLPAGAGPDDVDAAITAVIGPAMTRLSMRFDSERDYLDFWARHPAIGGLSAGLGTDGDLVRAYLLHDLVPDGAGAFRSSCVLEAIRIDGGMTLTDPLVHAAPREAVAAGVPVRLLWAPRGLADEPQGLYDDGRIAALDLPEALVTEQLPGVNHYTILFEEAAVGRIAAVVREAAGS